MRKTQARRRRNGEGSGVYPVGDGRLYASVTLPPDPITGKRKRRNVYGRTPQEVIEKRTKLLADMQAGKAVRSNGKTTLAQYLDSWLMSADVRPNTRKQYEVSVRVHIKPGLGRHGLTAFSADPNILRQWLRAKIQAGVSGSTVRLAHATLRVALSQAQSDGLILQNVAKLVRPPARNDYEAKYLSAAEARRFLAFLKNYPDQYGHAAPHRMEAFYSVALALGLRRGEALALSWQDVDLATGKLYIRHTLQRLGGKLVRGETKTKGSKRTIPLPPQLVEALKAHRDRQAFERKRAEAVGRWVGCAWEPVFVTERGTPIEPRNINRQLTQLLKQADMSNIRVHDCRHTAASLLLAQGCPVEVVSKILGHSNPTITYNVYAHVTPNQLGQATADIGNLLFGS